MLLLSISMLFIDIDNFNPYDFTGVSMTKLTSAIQPLTTAATLLACQTAAAAAAATVAATLPSVFDSRNLPPDVRLRYDVFMDPSSIVTQSAMIPFAMPNFIGCP